MKPNSCEGAACVQTAFHQHLQLQKEIERASGDVLLAPFIPGEFDSVFTKVNAILFERGGQACAYLGLFRHPERSQEQKSRAHFFEDHHYQIIGQALHY